MPLQRRGHRGLARQRRSRRGDRRMRFPRRRSARRRVSSAHGGPISWPKCARVHLRTPSSKPCAVSAFPFPVPLGASCSRPPADAPGPRPGPDGEDRQIEAPSLLDVAIAHANQTRLHQIPYSAFGAVPLASDPSPGGSGRGARGRRDNRSRPDTARPQSVVHAPIVETSHRSKSGVESYWP